MLDRKTKDVDASVELLEDRKKQSRIIFFIFFSIGWIFALIGILFLPSTCGEIGIGSGIVILIFATWFFMDINYYNTLLMMKKLHELEK